MDQPDGITRAELTFADTAWVRELLWNCETVVMGLPCVCDTPNQHSEECVMIREIAHSVFTWARHRREKYYDRP
jgi:hypothetical protein